LKIARLLIPAVAAIFGAGATLGVQAVAGPSSHTVVYRVKNSSGNGSTTDVWMGVPAGDETTQWVNVRTQGSDWFTFPAIRWTGGRITSLDVSNLPLKPSSGWHSPQQVGCQIVVDGKTVDQQTADASLAAFCKHRIG
jgi:hypothetical protein